MQFQTITCDHVFVIVLMVWLSEVEVNETVFEDQLEQAIATYTYFTFVKSALTLHTEIFAIELLL